MIINSLDNIKLVEIPKHRQFNNLLKTKPKIGKLTVIQYAGKNGNSHYWICRCECGNFTKTRAYHLICDICRSCGCLQIENTIKRSTTHGMSHSSEYKIRQTMINRCYCTLSDNYNRYGGRGIKVCERWLDSFENFLQDMGKRPSDKHSIDRIDVNGDYSPENCRWTTKKEQANNRNTNIVVEYNNEVLTLKQLSEKINIKYITLIKRYNHGDRDDKLIRPVKSQKRKS